MLKPKVILRNVLSNWIGFIAEACFAFFLFPFVVRQVGDTAYGLWVLILSMTGYFGLLTLGLRPAINKYVSEFFAQGKMKELNDLVNAALSVYAVMGLIILFGGATLSVFIDRLPFLPANLAAQNRWVVMVVALQVALNLPAVVFGGVLSGLQRYDISNAIGVSTTLSRAVLILVFLKGAPTLLSLSLISLVTTSGGYAFTIWAARRQCPAIKLRFGVPKRQTAVMLFRYSGVTALGQLGGRLFIYADSFVVTGLISVAAVTHYSIATNLIGYMRSLSEDSTSVLNPAASELRAKNLEEELRALWIHVTRALLLILLPISLGLIFLGREFIVLWMGSNFADSATIVAILAAAQAAVLAQAGTRAILFGLGRHQIVAKLIWIEGIVNITLSVILGRAYGLIGIATGSSIAGLMVGAIWLPKLVSSVMGVPLRSYLRQAYLRPVVTAAPMALLLYWMVRTTQAYTWIHLGTEIVVSSALYGTLAFFFCLKEKERSGIYASLQKAALAVGVRT